jgi:uracil-DNA glycosylase
MAGEMHMGGPQAIARAEALLSWWALAGVDMAVSEEPVNWLRPAPVLSGPSAAKAARGDALPQSLDAFHDHLATAPDLPEARWPGARIMPEGPPAPKLMLIFAAPESGAMLADEKADRLLNRMLAAIGLTREQVYVASLSLVAPPSAMIDADILSRLAERMRHHIALVAPQALLLVGDQTNRALAPTGEKEAGKNLPFVNHSGGTVEAVSIYHPRLMLHQPPAKAAAWNELRRLVRGWEQ